MKTRAGLIERATQLYARSFPVARGKLRLVDAVCDRFIHDQGQERDAVLKRGGHIVPGRIDDFLQRQLYFFGDYFIERKVLDAWEAFAPKASVVFDVGANVGVYSMVAKARSPAAAVHAFEPTAEIARRMSDVLALNRLEGVTVHPVAVSDASGSIALRRCRGHLGHNEGMNFVVDATEADTERVESVTLDDFCGRQGIAHVDLLKVDTQGHEHRVLAGANRLLRERRLGVVFFELNWTPSMGDACPAVRSVRLLEDAGYRFAPPGRHLEWNRSGAWMESLTDVIATRMTS